MSNEPFMTPDLVMIFLTGVLFGAVLSLFVVIVHNLA